MKPNTLFFAAIKAGDLAAVKTQLRDKPALVNAKDENGNSATLIAVYWGKHDIVKVLLRHKPGLSLFEAAAAGQLAQVKTWTRTKPKGAHAFSHDGFTALHLDAFFGHASVAHHLIRQHALVNAVAHNDSQVQPLHSAAAGGHVGICQMLLKAGADVNARQQHGFTPLHAAAQNGSRDLVMLFLNAGADKSAKTYDGRTAQDFALASGQAGLAALLTPPVGPLSSVILFVADMPKMRAFYEQVIGLSPVGHADANWVTYDTGGVPLSLHTQTPGKRSGGGAAQLVFRVDDVVTARETLLKRGAPWMGKPFSGQGLSFCDGRDPEDNLFQISTR
jgi:uncharacterized protein